MSHQFSLRWQLPTANGDLRWAYQAVEIWWDFESARSRNICMITGTILAPPWCMGFVVEKGLVNNFSSSPFLDGASVRIVLKMTGKCGHIKLLNQTYMEISTKTWKQRGVTPTPCVLNLLRVHQECQPRIGASYHVEDTVPQHHAKQLQVHVSGGEDDKLELAMCVMQQM